MKIVICGSMKFSTEMVDLKNRLVGLGHEVVLPNRTEDYASGKISSENSHESTQNKIAGNLIQEYFLKIKEADAVLVANYDKNGIKGYVGGNSFLEAGFAHVLDKKLFLLNGIPELAYSDELIALQPVIIDNDLSKVI